MLLRQATLLLRLGMLDCHMHRANYLVTYTGVARVTTMHGSSCYIVITMHKSSCYLAITMHGSS